MPPPRRAFPPTPHSPRFFCALFSFHCTVTYNPLNQYAINQYAIMLSSNACRCLPLQRRTFHQLFYVPICFNLMTYIKRMLLQPFILQIWHRHICPEGLFCLRPTQTPLFYCTISYPKFYSHLPINNILHKQICPQTHFMRLPLLKAGLSHLHLTEPPLFLRPIFFSLHCYLQPFKPICYKPICYKPICYYAIKQRLPLLAPC